MTKKAYQHSSFYLFRQANESQAHVKRKMKIYGFFYWTILFSLYGIPFQKSVKLNKYTIEVEKLTENMCIGA